MTDLPDFSKLEADVILRRAAEIEGTEDARRLSVRELRSIAGEAGFGTRAVEQAIAEARREDAAEEPRAPVRRSGFLVTQLSTSRTLPVQIGYEDLMRAVRLLQPYRDGPAQVKLEEHRITWQDRKGLRFTITSGRGETQLHVVLSRPILRKGRWIGWVKAAADRMEALIRLVASEGGAGVAGPPRIESGRDN